MSAENAKVFLGNIFCFDVGKDCKTFTLHSQLVSESSPVFRAMMDSQMKEALEGRVRVEHVDPDTFTRFAEYLHGNDYNPAVASVVLEQHEDSESISTRSPVEPAPEAMAETPAADEAFASDNPEVAADDDWNYDSWKASKKSRKFHARAGLKRLSRLEHLDEVVLPGVHARSFPILLHKTAQNDVDLMYDYAEILSHVQLYTFADQYQVENLQRLVLDKLRGALANTTFHPQKMHDFLYILIVAYEMTTHSDEKEPLCDLLTTFGAWHYQDLIATESYVQLMDDCKDAIRHLSQKVAQRL